MEDSLSNAPTNGSIEGHQSPAVPSDQIEQAPESIPENPQLAANDQPNQLNIALKNSSMISINVEENYDFYSTVDNSQFTSTMTRLIESPEPIIENDRFMFVNIENAEDDANFRLFSSLTEPENLNNDLDDVPLMRPNSPTAVEVPAETTEKTIDIVDEQVQEMEPLEEFVEQEINRAEYIAKIKCNLTVKDRLNSRNQSLQNKLVDYFRKKKVYCRKYISKFIRLTMLEIPINL